MSTRTRKGGPPRAAGILEHYLDLLDEAYDHRAWHGTTLRGALRGITATRAARRPAPARHNIWEIAVHTAYWKYAVARRLGGGARGSFPLTGSNWFRRPEEDSEQAWRRDLDLLEAQHRHLRAVLASLDPAGLGDRPAGSRYTRAFLMRGIAAHDLYHAGQIQLLKRLV
jgi:hypothetical protein